MCSSVFINVFIQISFSKIKYCIQELEQLFDTIVFVTSRRTEAHGELERTRSKVTSGQDHMVTSGANRHPKLRNSEFVQILIWNLDGQRRIASGKFGQPLNSDIPLKILPISFPRFIGNVGNLSSSKIRIYLTDQSGTEKCERNANNIGIVAIFITGTHFCFILVTIIRMFGFQFLDIIMFWTVLGQTNHTYFGHRTNFG